MQIRGHVKIHISLLPYSGKYPYITEIDNNMYVLSSPFNIVPPQMLISNLYTKDSLDVDYAKHDYTEYIISFKNNHSQLPNRLLTIPIGVNGLFHLHITPIFTYFC